MLLVHIVIIVFQCFQIVAGTLVHPKTEIRPSVSSLLQRLFPNIASEWSVKRESVYDHMTQTSAFVENTTH